MVNQRKVTLTANEIAQLLTQINSPVHPSHSKSINNSQKYLEAAASWVVNRRKETSHRFSTIVYGSPI